MERGVALWLLSSLGLSSIPVFLIFLDYHRRSNVHRALLYVAGFFAVVFVVALLPGRTLLDLALVTPVLLSCYVLLIQWRPGSKDRSLRR